MTKGTYGGFTLGGPWGFGGGLYIDNHGRIYPQIYGGEPGESLSAGYTPDLEGLLTGPSISWGMGRGPMGIHAGSSGSASGLGISTPGLGTTYGFGPFEMSDNFSKPWVTPLIRDSADAAGVPSRRNVWEYGYPASAPSANSPAKTSPQPGPPSVFATGAPPIPYTSASQTRMGGLPSMLAEAAGTAPSDPGAPQPGGLLGLIQEYMRSNPNRDAAR